MLQNDEERLWFWVEQGYSGENFAAVGLSKRWIVECTFGWLNRFRRLSKDDELYSEISEAMIYSSLICLMVK